MKVEEVYVGGALTVRHHYDPTNPKDSTYIHQQLGPDLPAASLVRIDGLSELLLPGGDMFAIANARIHVQHTPMIAGGGVHAHQLWSFVFAPLST